MMAEGAPSKKKKQAIIKLEQKRSRSTAFFNAKNAGGVYAETNNSHFLKPVEDEELEKAKKGIIPANT